MHAEAPRATDARPRGTGRPPAARRVDRASSGAATELRRALAPPESARAYKSVQMARARRLEARGDPPIAMSGCSNFAARSAGVKLRAELPSRRVAAHNSAQAPARAERPGGRLHAERAGVEPTGFLGPCGRGAPPPHPLAPARPIRPPGSRTCAHSCCPPSAAAPRPAGDATAMLHRERARSRRYFRVRDAQARRGARARPHTPPLTLA